MKCHYEVLGIPRDADDAEIKTAYRKLALRWHPDKNLNDLVHAKEQFQVVQQAYEILSDKQERAWYDKHREQILYGGNSEFEDKSLDVFQYFTTTCFKGYNDEEKGFYTVYRNVFDQIAKEDDEFVEEKEEMPNFGNSQSDYETVSKFYNYWMGYTTKKKYVWLNPYDIREGKGDRRVLRLIEKENKKVCQKAKKERNEEVRNLVAFVRKRDKRMQEFTRQIEVKTLENRKKQEILSKQKRLERKKMHENEKQAEWAKFDNVKSELEEIEKHLAQEFGEEISNSEDDEIGYNNLYCVACNKVFKTSKAFENHELSKKHKENFEKLKETMREEESLISNNLESENSLGGDIENIKDVTEEKASESESLASEKINVKLEEMSSLEEEEDILTMKKNKKKSKKGKRVLSVDESDEELNKIEPSNNLNVENFDVDSSKKQKKKKTSSKPKPEPTDKEIVENNVNENVASASKNKKVKKSKKEVTRADLSELDVSHCCVTCKADFPSKNKLFDHLKKTNHGIFIPKVKQNGRKNIKEK